MPLGGRLGVSGISGSFWEPLGASGREPLGASGSLWETLAVWKPQGASESFGEPLGSLRAFGSPRDHKSLHGVRMDKFRLTCHCSPCVLAYRLRMCMAAVAAQPVSEHLRTHSVPAHRESDWRE